MDKVLSPLIVLEPQDLNLTLNALTRKSVDCVACCIYHCSAWFRQDHGFDPPYGSHQLPAYLKYSVRLKLLAQLVHSRECKRFWGLKQKFIKQKIYKFIKH